MLTLTSEGGRTYRKVAFNFTIGTHRRYRSDSSEDEAEELEQRNVTEEKDENEEVTYRPGYVETQYRSTFFNTQSFSSEDEEDRVQPSAPARVAATYDIIYQNDGRVISRQARSFNS